ncbi:hypothetical protein COY95_04110 [Candidatus Woesearchaeota archaeon CG_4_10_14_0_8_um_filter_47_5]|nr:MAG: hypothetical protein COY95_04110 [Candidatus Woesearchaeota archaeon CG_4_10_14_0_8_um_filter_47_5]
MTYILSPSYFFLNPADKNLQNLKTKKTYNTQGAVGNGMCTVIQKKRLISNKASLFYTPFCCADSLNTSDAKT